MKHSGYVLALTGMALAIPFACSDDEETDGATPTSSSSSASSSGSGSGGTGGGSGGEGGEACEDPANCVYCNDILTVMAEPSDICCDSEAIFNALADCTCVTGCAMECADAVCAGNPITDECDACLTANCRTEFTACITDCAPEGCPGEGGGGGAGVGGGGGGGGT